MKSTTQAYSSVQIQIFLKVFEIMKVNETLNYKTVKPEVNSW